MVIKCSPSLPPSFVPFLPNLYVVYARCCSGISATADMEGIITIKMGVLMQLSIQELIDWDIFNYGCCGGHVERAFLYSILNGGIHLESNYRTLMGEGPMKFLPVSKFDARQYCTFHKYLLVYHHFSIFSCISFASIGPPWIFE